MANLKLNKNKNKILLSIETNGEEWKALISNVKESLINDLEIKGFRKGKVPIAIAEKSISQNQIWDSAVDKLVKKNYSKAIEMMIEEKIIDNPTISVSKISDTEVEVVLESYKSPEIKLGDLSKIKIKTEILPVEQKIIDDEIKNLDQHFSKEVEIESDEKIKTDDKVVLDFSGSVDKEEFEGGTAKDYELVIGTNSFIDTFEDQLIGLKVNDEKTISVTFPETYLANESLQGKLAEFKIKINKILRTKLLDKSSNVSSLD